MNQYLNIGVLAHVDAGKTSLTERLLYDSGAIDRLGSVDAGSTQTDSLEIERKRGITVRSAVVSFSIGALQVNVIDTPGHPDFVAEVERALRVLDGVVLVVSAVEGVQSQTRVLLRSLRRLRIPTLIFVNKVDRKGAQSTELLKAIEDLSGVSCPTMSEVENLGSFDARVRSLDVVEVCSTMDVAGMLAIDGPLADRSVNDGSPEKTCQVELRELVSRCDVRPVFFGSAITGVGIDRLVAGIAEFLAPSALTERRLLRARVFKIERGPTREKVAYVRIYSGSIDSRDRVRIYRNEADGSVAELDGRVSRVHVFDRAGASVSRQATAGCIAKLYGLASARIGDQLGTGEGLSEESVFRSPTLETIVEPIDPARRSDLFAALSDLAEQDPLIAVRQPVDGEISVSLFGEVQKEVLSATLSDTFGIDVAFSESATIHVERLVGNGEALHEFDPKGPNFFWATVGLELKASPISAGVTYDIGSMRGRLPASFHKAIETTVYETLRQGLYGWEVLGCHVTLTRVGFLDAVSTAGHFRDATALTVAEALKKSKTNVFEPLHRFELETPVECVGRVLAALDALRAVPAEYLVGDVRTTLYGTLPSSAVHELSLRLPKLTSGEGTLVTEFEGYGQVVGHPPRRTHVGPNPYDREEYMLHVNRRI